MTSPSPPPPRMYKPCFVCGENHQDIITVCLHVKDAKDSFEEASRRTPSIFVIETTIVILPRQPGVDVNIVDYINVYKWECYVNLYAMIVNASAVKKRYRECDSNLTSKLPELVLIFFIISSQQSFPPDSMRSLTSSLVPT